VTLSTNEFPSPSLFRLQQHPPTYYRSSWGVSRWHMPRMTFLASYAILGLHLVDRRPGVVF
jgi:hypothetical protein